jgi:uncharacterized protein (TIGR04255 family)
MKRVVLSKKPLVEAIFELRWTLKEVAPSVTVDPHYMLLVGGLYERLKGEYPFHERLPTATIPDEMAGYVTQHRFRKGEERWPLVQVGPGVITANDTEGYVWEDFEQRLVRVVAALFDTYPKSDQNLTVARLMLRYIDAVPFDFGKDDVFAFLKAQMKTEIRLHERLFEDERVDKTPEALDLRFAFRCSKPRGSVRLRFVRGDVKGSQQLVWETQVQSVEGEAPSTREGIAEWVAQAHGLTDDWFFKLIEGGLLEAFK